MSKYFSSEDGPARVGHTNKPGDGMIMCTTPGRQPRPEKPKKIDPVKEWERVKKIWKGNVAAWQRYSGLKLPDDYND